MPKRQARTYSVSRHIDTTDFIRATCAEECGFEAENYGDAKHVRSLARAHGRDTGHDVFVTATYSETYEATS